MINYTESMDLERFVMNLNSDDRNLRLKTVEELGKSGNKNYIEFLILALKDIDPDVRLEASDSLFRFGPIIVDSLIPLLDDDDFNLKISIIELLGEIGDKETIKYIIPFLDDKNIFIRIAAVRSLGGFNDEQIIEPIISILNDKSYMLRNVAVEVLGNIGNEKAKGALYDCLHDESFLVRETAKEAIVNMNANIEINKQIEEKQVPVRKGIDGVNKKPNTLKICEKCGESKSKKEFYNNIDSNDGLSLYCKSCMRKYTKKEKPSLKENPLKLLKEIR